MILNSPLKETIIKFTSVDLSCHFTEPGVKVEGPVWLRWNKCLMVLTSSNFQSIQAIIWADKVIRGDRLDPANIFKWDKVRLNFSLNPE